MDSGGYITVDIKRSFLPQQIRVMKLVKRKRYILYSGAVRAGKTLLAANVAITTCIDNPGCIGVMGSLTTPQLSDVIFKVFQQELDLYQDALDKEGIPIQLARIKRSKGDMKAIFWNGSEVWFKPCDDEVKLRGPTLDFVCLDEPIEIDESVFKQFINRISGTGNLKNQFILLTTNPGSQSHWIYKRFFETVNKNYVTVQTTTYDNFMLPRYSEYIEELKGSGDDDWIRRFLDGTWDAFSGQIYKEFNKTKHVGEYQKIKGFEYVTLGVDWGFRNPSCILAIGIKDKHVYVLDEYYMREKTELEILDQAYSLAEKYNARTIYFDPSSPELIFQATNKGLPAEKAERNVNSRITKIKALLKKGRLHIDVHCVNLIREMGLYRYKKDRTGENPVEVPAKVDDHAPDSLGYGLTGYKAFSSPSLVGWVPKKLWDF